MPVMPVVSAGSVMSVVPEVPVVSVMSVMSVVPGVSVGDEESKNSSSEEASDGNVNDKAVGSRAYATM